MVHLALEVHLQDLLGTTTNAAHMSSDGHCIYIY
jgi:hypothetical protein